MIKTTPMQNKALVLQAFDALFNKRDYKAAEIEQERKTEELRELRLNFRGRAPGICQGPMRFASKGAE